MSSKIVFLISTDGLILKEQKNIRNIIYESEMHKIKHDISCCWELLCNNDSINIYIAKSSEKIFKITQKKDDYNRLIGYYE